MLALAVLDFAAWDAGWSTNAEELELSRWYCVPGKE
jgi:hypothetical protein